jgi:hypothetical protein
LVKQYLNAQQKVIPSLLYERGRDSWTEEQLDYVNRYKVMSFPTLVTEEDGVIVGSQNIINYISTHDSI